MPRLLFVRAGAWSAMNEAIEVFDDRLLAVVKNTQLEKLCSGATWSEGPVWLAEDDAVLWSDIPGNRMLRWSEHDGMTVWADGVDFTNGHYRDLQGNLLHCSHGKRGIYKTPLVNGALRGDTPLQCMVDRYQGKRLNSPNDVVVKRDGTVWFTDPPYGILSDREGHQAPREQSANHVFCFDPSTQVLTAATDWMDEPNGLAFSPDERLLYVSDTSAALRPAGQGHHHIVVFDVGAHNRLANPRVFAQVYPGLADGLRVDVRGWIYTSSGDSVQVFHPDGTLLGKLHMPEKVGNLTFGGVRGDQLYVAASTSLYRWVLNTQGLQCA